MTKLLVPAICLLGALAIACGGNNTSAASTSPTPKPESTATRPVETATIAPTPAPEPPTATPEPPTPEPPTPEPPTRQPPRPAAPAPPVSQPAPNNPPPAPPAPAPAGPVSTTITASGLAFTTRQISARTGASVTVTLSNQDSFVPHDLAIAGVASIPSCTGPCSGSVTFTAPAPGSYAFVCTLHPDMTGTLRVSP